MAAGGLGACTVQPLYGNAASGGTVRQTTARIDIDPVNDRVAQVVRNKAMFQMTGGGGVHDPLYRMRLTVSYSESGLGITRVDSSPVNSVKVTASYEVKRIDTDEVVYKGTSHAQTTYNLTNQAFANSRAKLDAEDRAATQVANDLSVRVAAAVARGV
jgi:LPS-assembly lipoprotein